MSLILDGTNGVSDIDGSASTPAIRGTDANTGIFFGTDVIGFSEGGVQSGEFNASGNLKLTGNLSVGGATPATSGSGITFPATQSASSDANTLDDYEEGTWTPADGSGAGLSFSSVSATYEKIGRTVIARFALTYPSTANGSSTTISGLPFTTANSQDSRQGFITICNESTVSRPIPNANGTTIVLINSSGANISNATMSTRLVYATLIYQV
jgi:hypothetical protein